MTPPSPPSPPNDPDDAVRRLLAAARADGPPPPEVVARLDRTLSDLRREHAAGSPPDALPGPLAPPVAARPASALSVRYARREGRARLTRRLLVAAAVIAVLAGTGPALRQLAGSLSGGETSASSDSGGSGASESDAAAPAAALPFIRPRQAAADVADRVPRRLRAAADVASPGPAAGSTTCVVARRGQSAVAVSYGGRLATLVFEAPAGGEQRVSVYACDGVHGGSRLRSLTLPAP